MAIKKIEKIVAKIVVPALFMLVFMTGPVPAEEEAYYFLYIPGVKGEVQQPGFEGWIRCIAFQYLLPGIPSPGKLLRIPPDKLNGILTALEVGKPFASFSKTPDKIDSALAKARSDALSFSQWEFALCGPGGEPYMRFIFKDVVVSGVTLRDEKQYVTFKYGKVIWNYTGMKK